MPRAGLDTETVVAAAAAVADRDGLQALSLSKLASELGVRPPSLYAHIRGLDDLRRRIAVSAARRLSVELRAAAAGVADTEALRGIALAYRAFARAHPGMYASLQPAAGVDPAFTELVDVVLAALRGYGLEGDDAVHAVRIVRSGLHGFVSLELEAGFGLPLDLDETFERLVAALDRGLRSTP
jgi:AcrR family transcriptional regulator